MTLMLVAVMGGADVAMAEAREGSEKEHGEKRSVMMLNGSSL